MAKSTSQEVDDLLEQVTDDRQGKTLAGREEARMKHENAFRDLRGRVFIESQSEVDNVLRSTLTYELDKLVEDKMKDRAEVEKEVEDRVEKAAKEAAEISAKANTNEEQHAKRERRRAATPSDTLAKKSVAKKVEKRAGSTSSGSSRTLTKTK